MAVEMANWQERNHKPNELHMPERSRLTGKDAERAQ